MAALVLMHAFTTRYIVSKSCTELAVSNLGSRVSRVSERLNQYSGLPLHRRCQMSQQPAICDQTVSPRSARLAKLKQSFMPRFCNLGLTRAAISGLMVWRLTHVESHQFFQITKIMHYKCIYILSETLVGHLGAIRPGLGNYDWA
jgi:hypothetical protein